MFTYISSLLIKKDICDRLKVSVKLPCVCVCLLSGDLFILSVIVSSSFSYLFFFIHTSVLSYPHSVKFEGALSLTVGIALKPEDGLCKEPQCGAHDPVKQLHKLLERLETSRIITSLI